MEQVTNQEKEKVYVLDGFERGAVSYDLFYEALERQENFLGKASFLLGKAWEDEDEMPTVLSILEDLCNSLKKDGEEFGSQGAKERKATGGEIDIEALREQGIPGLIEGAIECGIVGLNPAEVLWDAIRKRRGEDEQYKLPYAFSPGVIQYFEIENRIAQVNEDFEEGYYEVVLQDLKHLAAFAEDMFRCKQARTETDQGQAEAA